MTKSLNTLFLLFIFCLPIVCLPMVSQSAEISQKEKNTFIIKLQEKITQQYVLTDKIDLVVNALSQLKTSDAFQQATSYQETAKLAATTIRNFDGHFSVLWRDANKMTKQKTDYEGWFSQLARKNSGFNKVEILKGNVGYIDFWGFDNLNERSRKKAEAVLFLVEDTDALIFDMRKNGGGSPEMIQLIMSHFLPEKTHLNSFYNRLTGDSTEFWSFDDIQGVVRPKLPIYILTSHFTFSAAEEFSYNFKHLKRATIIGEATGGGANPVHFVELGDGFRASSPISKAVNPITKTNWEGVGVKPDIPIDADKAFDAAYQLALSKIKSNISNRYQIKEINEQLESLTAK